MRTNGRMDHRRFRLLLLWIGLVGLRSGRAFSPSHHHHRRFAGSTGKHRFYSSAVLSSIEIPPPFLTSGVGFDNSLLPPLVVLIPAYNERDRIEPTLRSVVHYLSDNHHFINNASIVVVDDGSTDGTTETVIQIAALTMNNTISCPIITCVTMPVNQGKGAALAHGIRTAASLYDTPFLILSTDADGSANIADLKSLYQALCHELSDNHPSASDYIQWKNPALACGYRTYDDTAAGRRFFRWGFRSTVQLLLLSDGNFGIRDTQCGFKLMTDSAAKILYKDLHLTRWSHDVEVFHRAKLLNIPVTEASVQWQDKDGSKLTAEGIFKVATRMFVDVCYCRIAYEFGWWTLPQTSSHVPKQ